MVKTLIISSDTPDEDMQAAFTIVKESETDARLDKIVWYSNIGKFLTVIHTKMAHLETEFTNLTTAFNQLGIQARGACDKVFKLEKQLAEMKKDKPEEKKK